LSVVLAAVPCGVLLWLALRRRAPALVGSARFLAPGLRRRLFVDPAYRLQDLTLTEVIALGDDVLLGYTGGHGSWFTVDPDDRGRTQVMEGLDDIAPGQLFLPDLVRDTEAMVLLHQWRDQGTRLTSVVPRTVGVVALADRRRRTAVLAALPGRGVSEELP
jgi:hypothetical protein